jgi:hypothetical protein
VRRVYCGAALHGGPRGVQQRLHAVQHLLRGLQQVLQVLRQLFYALLQRRELEKFF